MSFVATLKGDELGKVEGVTFKNRILQYYNSLGGSVNCAFGNVLLDEKSVSSDIGHPNYKSKTCSFAAIKDVLEKGSVTTPMQQHFVHGKKQPTGVISANITIGGIPFKMDVVVIQSLDGTLRIRCHDVYQLPPNENHQRGTVTNCILENNNIPSYDLFGNYVAKVQGNNQTNKENKHNNKNYRKIMIKNKIRLTESDLHRIIKETINELDWKTYVNAARKQAEMDGKYGLSHEPRKNRAYKFNLTASHAFDKQHGYNDGYSSVYSGEPSDWRTTQLPKLDLYASNGNEFLGKDYNDEVEKPYVRRYPDKLYLRRVKNKPKNMFYPEVTAAFNSAEEELDNYYNGNYEYEPNGRGWHLKDGLNEAKANFKNR